jgi:hypothetical protein
LWFVFLSTAAVLGGPQDYFGIRVVDDATGRGVPMVELKTTSSLTYYTDSDGYVALNEPDLMNRAVWFGISSHGYEFPPDGFGERGVKLIPQPGITVVLKIQRINIAERLYRITGEGIYRDTLLLGLRPPLQLPGVNAQITGQDGVLNAIFQGKLFWFYGDTSRLSYPLGNYSMTGATTDLPQKIDPSTGFELNYFTGSNGFARPMAPMPGEGVVWLHGLVTLPDEAGEEQMVAFYQRRRGLGEVLENGFVKYSKTRDQFEKLKTVPLHPAFHPTGYPFRVKADDGVEYIYFTTPYPAWRVRADLTSYLDLSRYESYRPSNDHGSVGYRWTTGPPDQPDNSGNGTNAPSSPFHLSDVETGKPLRINSASCAWNAYRRRYVMIASEQNGATILGEVWYSEAERPEGPWLRARKIITHANKPHDAHDFYNPVHHDFFDQAGGRVIYLEGSYVNTFSGNHQETPLYEYNQIMYRLDLADPRLKLE